MYGNDEIIRRQTILYQARGEADVIRGASALNSALGKIGSTTLTVGRSYDSLVRQLDPVVRAQERHTKAVRTTQKAINEGVIDLNEYGRTLDQIDSKFGRFGRGADIQAYGKSLDDLRAKHNPLFKAGREYRQHLREIARDAKVGAISQRELADATTRAKTAFAAQVREMQGQRLRALGRMPTNRLRQHQVANLGYQVNDVISGLLMGQRPGQVAMQQGGQIFQILNEGGGGLGAGLKRLGNFMKDLITPVRAVTLGFAGMGIAAVAAFNSAEKRAIALQRSLNGVGAASGLSARQLEEIASRNTGGLSTSSAASTAAGFAGAGLSGNQIGALTGSTRGYAKAFGLEVDAAAKELTSAFKDPVKGIDALNKRFGTLDAATQRRIELQRISGDYEGARNTLLQAYLRALENTTRQTGVFGRVMDKIGVGISNFISKFGNVLLRDAGGGTQQQVLQDRFSQQLKRLNELSNGSPASVQVLKAFPDAIENATKALNKTNQDLLDLANRPRIKALEVERTRNASLATETIKQFASELFPLEKLKAQRSQLQKALGDEDTVKKFGATSDQARLALERLNTAINNFKTPLDILRENGELAVKAVMAVTLQQRIAVQMEKAKADALRNSNDKLQAAQAAENARNLALANAAKQLQDAARTANQERQLIGLTPGERRLKQIEFDGQRLSRDTNYAGTQTTAGRAISGLNSTFASLIAKLEQKFPDARMTSGFRTYAEQAGLRARYGAGAAIPGTSRHEIGVAADYSTKGMTSAVRAAFTAYARSIGLSVKSSNHGALHVEGPRSMAGGRISGAAMAGASPMAGAGAITSQKKVNESLRQQVALELQIKNALGDKENLYRSQITAIGKSAFETEKAAAFQRLYTQAVRENGEAFANSMLPQINSAAEAFGRLAEKQKQFNVAMENFGSIRSAAGSVLSSLVRGDYKSAIDNFNNALLNMLSNQMLNQLLGRPGAPGGLLGGSIFNAILGGGGGGGSAPNAFGLYSSGGYTGNQPRSAVAGLVHGQEFVANANATSKYRPILEAMNSGNFQVPSSSHGPAPTQIVNILPPQGYTAHEEQTEDSSGGQRLEVRFEKMVGNAMSRPGSSANRTLQSMGGQPAIKRR